MAGYYESGQQCQKCRQTGGSDHGSRQRRPHRLHGSAETGAAESDSRGPEPSAPQHDRGAELRRAAVRGEACRDRDLRSGRVHDPRVGTGPRGKIKGGEMSTPCQLWCSVHVAAAAAAIALVRSVR